MFALAEMFGPGGIIIGGAIALGMAISSIHEKTLELVKAQMSYNAELQQSSAHWGDIAAGQIKTTGGGKEAQTIAATMRDQWRQVSEQQTQLRLDRSFGDSLAVGADRLSMLGLISKMTGSSTGPFQAMREYGRGEETRQANEKIRNAENIYLQMKTVQDKARAAQEQELADDRDYAVAKARTDVLVEGPLKRRQEAMNKAADDQRQLVQRSKDLMDQLKNEQFVEMAQAIQRDPLGDQTDLHQKHLQQRADLQKDSDADLVAQKEESALALRGVDVQEQQERVKDQDDLNHAIISVNKVGFARQLADLQETNTEKVNEYARAGRDITLLLQTNADKVVALQQDANRQILIDTKNANLDLQVLLGQRTRYAAEQQKLINNNLGETDEMKLGRLHELDVQHFKDMVAWTQTALSGVRTLRGETLALSLYTRDVQEALNASAISRVDALDLIRRKAAELGITTPYDPGKALTMGVGGGGGRLAMADIPFMNWDVARGSVSTTIDALNRITVAVNGVKAAVDSKQGFPH